MSTFSSFESLLISLPSENKIKESWCESYKNIPQVSIVCITFNQQRYIKYALHGFLNQKTRFPFEIIVHDDASSDSTARILKYYESKYPSIIKLVLQKENQFSKSMYLPLRYCFERVGESKYIALCEGDDFWVMENKLQLQYDSMEKNQEVDICFTSCFFLRNNEVKKNTALHNDSAKIFTLNEVAKRGGGFMPTASLFFKKGVVTRIPDWILQAPVVDFYLQVIASSHGGALYIPARSCVYRVGAEGSWSMANRERQKGEIINNLDNSLRCSRKLADFGVSQQVINTVKAGVYCHAASVFLLNGYYKESKFFIGESWKVKKQLSRLQILIYYSRFFLPALRLLIFCKNKAVFSKRSLASREAAKLSS